MAVDLRQTHFRFGLNELAESTHGWYAAEDADASIPADTTFLLRFTEQESGGTALGNCDAQFQYNLNGLGWNDITTTSSVVKAVTTPVFANGADLTKRLSGTGTFESSGDGGTHDGLSGGPQNDIAANGNSETECAMQIVGTDVSPGDTIQFRFTSPDATVTYIVTPTATVSSGNVALTPDSTSLALAFFAPTISVSDNKIVAPDSLTLPIGGFAPAVSVSDHKVATPSPAVVTVIGFAPTVVVGGGATLTPAPAVVTVVGFAPTVTVSGEAEEVDFAVVLERQVAFAVERNL